MLLLLSLIAADPVVTVQRVVTEQAPAAPRRSRYRLDPTIAGPADGKAAAVATTGNQCAVTGPARCTRKPRTVYKLSY